MELIQDYEEIKSFPKPSLECRAALYSANGEYFAYTQPNEVVVVKTTKSAPLQARLELQDVFDIFFSPNGTFLALWCKPICLDKESGVWTKNVKIIEVASGNTVLEWSNKHQGGWKPQFTLDEKILAKNNNNKEIHFFDLSTDSPIDLNKPAHKFKLESTIGSFQISPGLNPSIAIFIPEKNGQPASVLIYNIPNFNQPICSKNFFKAERCQLKWNSIGTALLALASTDHDTTNKSYYGETNLYLLGIAGSYDLRIHLDKEGPIHDITWSPSAREFGVIYGYMPAKTTFFDARGNSIFSLPPSPRNTILFSPHAKFVLVAGFGNLQGTVDVYDRQNKFQKITTFEATNTSVCEWSPCGRFILTATTSPRLRVDNGCKVWHATGKLIYMKEYQELYSITWKPQKVSEFPPLKVLEAAPAPHVSTKEYLEKKKTIESASVSKPAGAYRPPHARRTTGSVAATSLHQLEARRVPGASVPGAVPGASVPGAVPGSARAGKAAVAAKVESKAAAKNRKKREAKKKEGETPEPESNEASPAPNSESTTAATAAATSAAPTEGGSVIGGVASMEDKKVRSLLKKLRAIELLKMKQANGETLEDTQVSKIQKEEDIRTDLENLGWSE